MFTALDSARESESTKETMFELYDEQKQLIGTCKADYSQKHENFEGMAPMEFASSHKVFEEAKSYRVCKQEDNTVILIRNTPLPDIIFTNFGKNKYILSHSINSISIDTSREGT